MNTPLPLTTVNRRAFIKTSILTAAAVGVLSQGKALAQTGSGGIPQRIKYALKCDSDPRKGLPSDPVYSGGVFKNVTKETIFGGSNEFIHVKLELETEVGGPVKGDVDTMFEYSLKRGHVKIVVNYSLLNASGILKADQSLKPSSGQGSLNLFHEAGDHKYLVNEFTGVESDEAAKPSVKPLALAARYDLPDAKGTYISILWELERECKRNRVTVKTTKFTILVASAEPELKNLFMGSYPTVENVTGIIGLWQIGKFKHDYVWKTSKISYTY
jgi:hypothetical protein